jgi:hypothetical protein
VTFADSAYCLHNITLLAGGTLLVSGASTINMTGTLVDQGQVVNTMDVLANLQINTSATGTGRRNVLGGNDAYLDVNAPGLAVRIAGGPVFGSLLGRTLAVTGTGSIHVDTH